jgi:hypothetical protein
VSSINLNDLQLGYEKQLFNQPGGGSQNHPRIVASGDTMAVVWEQVVGLDKYIMFTYSLTGASGLGAEVDTISNVLTGGYHINPDIAYSNGKFYVVFADEVAEKIYLMEGILYGTSTIGIPNTPSSDDLTIHATGNLYGDAITISSTELLNETCFVSIHNSSGQVCESHELQRLQNSQSMKLDQPLTSGIYLISIYSKDFFVSAKWVIVH